MEENTSLLEKIRPRLLRKQLQQLQQKDFDRIKKKYTPTAQKNCIACHSSDLKLEFQRLDFPYSRCLNCNTLFLSQRFSDEAIIDYFTNSEASKFWAEKIFPTVEEQRYEKIAKPRVRDIKRILAHCKISAAFNTVAEIGPGTGIFRNAAMEANLAERYDCIEPSPAACSILEKQDYGKVFCGSLLEFADKKENQYSAVFANGVIEHPTEIDSFFKSAQNILSKEGYLILASSGADGLDSFVIPDGLPNAWPPQVQNFLSKKGLEYIGNRANLKLIAYETIGQLDVDLLYESSLKENNVAWISNWSKILDCSHFRTEFQQLLIKYNRSGFFLVIFQKK